MSTGSANISANATPHQPVINPPTPQTNNIDTPQGPARPSKSRSIRERRGSMRRVGSIPESISGEHSTEQRSPAITPRQNPSIYSGLRVDATHLPHNPVVVNDGGMQWLEKDIRGNFLCESHFYRGFYYLLKKTDVEPAATLRDSLFPSLALALEGVLHDLVVDQQEREAKAKKAQQAAASAPPGMMEQRRTSLRGMSVLQHPISVAASHTTSSSGGSSVASPAAFVAAEHPIIMLAKQLKQQVEKRKAKTVQRVATVAKIPPPSAS